MSALPRFSDIARSRLSSVTSSAATFLVELLHIGKFRIDQLRPF
jgi:hypothetical protein